MPGYWSLNGLIVAAQDVQVRARPDTQGAQALDFWEDLIHYRCAVTNKQEAVGAQSIKTG
jgi:hypothetical protein